MRVNPWFVVVLVFLLTDVVVFFAAKVYWASPAVPAAVESASPGVAPALTVVSVPVRAVPAVPPGGQLQQACVNGAVWMLDARVQQWVKQSPVLRCDPRTGRWLPSKGYTIVYGPGREPKSS